MNDQWFNHIIRRLIDNANDILEDEKTHPDDKFVQGEKFAYYLVLDSIKNDLITMEYDLGECGLDIDLDEKYM